MGNNKSSETHRTPRRLPSHSASRDDSPPRETTFSEKCVLHPTPAESFPASNPLLFVPCVENTWATSPLFSAHLIDAEESTLLRQFNCACHVQRGSAAYMFGSYCALGTTNDGQVEICDVAGQKLVQRLPHLHSSVVNDSCWIGHHGLLATGSTDQSVRLWRINDDTLESGKDLRVGTLHNRRAAGGSVTVVRCQDGPWRDRVVTATRLKAHIWDLLTYKHVRSFVGGDETGVYGVELSETADLLAICARGIRVFDTRTCEKIFENVDLSFSSRSFWSKSRNLLVMCGHFNTKISIYDIRRPSTPYARWRHAHGSSLFSFSGCCEIDAERFSTAGVDKSCKVWSYGGKLLRAFNLPHMCHGVCLYGAEMLTSYVAAEDVEERVQYLMRSLLASHGSVRVEVGGGSRLIPAALVLE